MEKKKSQNVMWVGLLVLAFVLLVAVMAYLLLRVRGIVPGGKREEVGVEDATQLTQVVSEVGSPVRKMTKGSEGVRYLLVGSFVGEVMYSEPWAYGDFVIRGDEKQRKLRIFIGAVDGQTSIGIYEGSIGGDTEWQLVPTESVVGELSNATEVELDLRGEVSDRGDEEAKEMFLKEALEHQEVLDTISEEIKTGEYSFKVPPEYSMSAHRVGVLR